MRTICASLLSFALCCAAPAQQRTAESPTAAELQAEFDLALRAWTDANKAARAAGDRAAQERLRDERPERRFAERFAAAAAARAGQPAAVPYLVWVVQRGGEDLATPAMTTLMEAHLRDPGIRLAIARLGGLKHVFGTDRVRRWLDAVLAENHDPHVAAQARYTRAAMYVGTRAVATSEELRLLAIDDLLSAKAILADHPDLSRSLLQLCNALLDESQRLEPGLPAPEIEGEDLDGIAFKLSDYRGKVVLLDFWGDW